MHHPRTLQLMWRCIRHLQSMALGELYIHTPSMQRCGHSLARTYLLTEQRTVTIFMVIFHVRD